MKKNCLIRKKKVSLQKIKTSLMENNKKINLSIIIPVYNVEKYIRQCLDSVFNQGMKDDYYEIIIINDGTQDHSIEVIQDIIDHHKNVKIISQNNQGVSTARNNGIEKAIGKYILMLDSDDLLVDNSLPILLEKALSYEYDLIVADYTEMTNDSIAKKVIKNNIPVFFEEKTGEQLLLEDLNPRKCYLWRILYRRDFLIREKISFIPGIIFEDIPFVHMCFLKATKCLRAHQLFYIYRRGNQPSATFNFTKEKAKDLSIAISKLWEMTKIKGLNSKILKKLQDDTFVSFSILMHAIAYNIDDSEKRAEITKELKQLIPDLYFGNGIKQKINTFLFYKAEHLYINLRVKQKKIIKPISKLVFLIFQGKK